MVLSSSSSSSSSTSTSWPPPSPCLVPLCRASTIGTSHHRWSIEKEKVPPPHTIFYAIITGRWEQPMDFVDNIRTCLAPQLLG
ncbi:hypothetical protein BDA96_04G182700 [Sorghum bicolor]|uniref:Uncharacterized protein n=2 Tax=Sorghum bicolor TaxID=4558 RepID=A0A921R5A3_SORBI|nr:hypothetical protein BDA96_04G182700 [Sorghum bicolor]KXG30355.1 hypothetical protein SORBI_3004G170100 [Sorghum bicolor]